ncbi:MAG: hypothetical protein ACOX4G_14365 [Limnochordia bacterium]
MALITTGAIFILAGILVSLTGIGAVIGVPLAVLGIIFGILGLAGAAVAVVLAFIKLVLFILFSPFILCLWLLRLLWHLVS